MRALALTLVLVVLGSVALASAPAAVALDPPEPRCPGVRGGNGFVLDVHVCPTDPLASTVSFCMNLPPNHPLAWLNAICFAIL